MMRFSFVLAIITITMFAACDPDSTQAEVGLFKQVSSTESGIDFSNDLTYQTDLNIIEYLYYYNGGGVAVGDINNDGLEDIYFTANQKEDQLYLNLGDLKFKNITATSGIAPDLSWSSGVTMDDVNGDGHMDIYVCKVSLLANASSQTHNLLYINDGQGSFVESASQYGLDFKGYATQASFFDYDNDGDLDMYLLNHSVHSTSSYGKADRRKEKDLLSGDVLFENRLKEEGKFVDVTARAGIYSSALGYGLALITSDINGDHWPDIYVGNDFHENDYLYINNQDGTFSEKISEWTNHTSQFTMGVDAADMNADGSIDVFTTDMMPYDAKILMKSASNDSEQISGIKKDLGFNLQYARNHFHLNATEGSFKEIAHITETEASDWSWSPLIQDFNNDGDMDIFVTNGIVKRPNDLDYINYVNERAQQNDERDEDAINKALIDKMPTLKLQNILFQKSSSSDFAPYEKDYIGAPSYSTGAAYSDLDNDGDLDLIINNVNEEAMLMENTSPDENGYISIAIKYKSGLPAKGTKVKVYQSDNVTMREYITTKGFQSSSSHSLHFGLASDVDIDSIIVIAQGGTTYSLSGEYTVDQHYDITIGDADSVARHSMVNESPDRFQLRKLLITHVEDDFRDIDREKLMPEKLSREGPAVAYADFNGDKIQDLYLGGSRLQPAVLLIGKADGAFEPLDMPSFDQDKSFEDVDAAALDFDQDGDLDLYVVSGGGDKKELDKMLQDRLYVNDGNGHFDRVPLSLPHTNGGSVSTGDYNQDGYPDLFIGGRSIPGSYGLSPYSFIIKNISGQNIELVHKSRFGMITDSEWIDMDGDDRLDLVMTGDWMPITVYLNKGDDQFENATEAMGLAGTTGMWNSLDFADLNKDGVPDIVSGNRGLNSPLRIPEASTVSLYMDDFDENGQVDPVLFYDQQGAFIPFAFKDNLTAQMPFLKKKFTSYDAYTEVNSLQELTGKSVDDILQYLQITELRSTLFISQPHGYKATPLPDLAQVSTVQDAIITTSNGKVNLFYVGNNRSESHQLGHTLSNPGGVLSSFDSDSYQFKLSNSLGLPHDIVAKHMIVLSADTYLIVCNDGQHMILHDNGAVR